jgi:peptide deformylase
VVEYGNEEDEEVPKKLYTLVNPEITRSSEEKVIATEACLSIPGYVGDVERPTSITVKGLNRFGRPQRVKAEGWLARIFQHEIDHLDGVLYIDRAEKVWKLEEQDTQVVPAD